MRAPRREHGGPRVDLERARVGAVAQHDVVERDVPPPLRARIDDAQDDVAPAPGRHVEVRRLHAVVRGAGDVRDALAALEQLDVGPVGVVPAVMPARNPAVTARWSNPT